MNAQDAEIFRCPRCRQGLRFGRRQVLENGRVVEGTLTCASCAQDYPIERSIPRFVGRGHYAESFGHQWKTFARVQTGPSQASFNRTRFFATTAWPDDLRGRTILEAGCGAGRFTGVALETGAVLYSFDLSEAVEACDHNISDPGQRARHHLFQADLYAIPLPEEMFDHIFCLGVLQHCPDVKRAFLGLVPYLKPGGELAVDCYLSHPTKDWVAAKYWLRPFFRWWGSDALFRFWTAIISVAYDIKLLLTRIPVVGRRLAALIPIGRLREDMDAPVTVDELKEMKTLSVVDMLGPRYDQPQTLKAFAAWSREAGLEVLDLTLGYNGINLRARRPSIADSQ